MADTVSPIELGKRISAARKERNISQEDAAQHLGLSRPTYIAIEKGARPAKPEEIVALAGLLGKSVNDLVANRSTIDDFAPQFRITQTLPGDRAAVDKAIGDFRQVCNDYLWLEEALSSPVPRRMATEVYTISNLRVEVAAEDIAQLERSRLNLGMGPIPDIVNVLEEEVGINVFVLPVDVFRIAGMFVYNDRLGGCILINGLHPISRQTWSVAHEYGHFLTNRYHNEITVLLDYERKPRSEQFADRFASSFLMPAPGIRRRFNAVVESRGDFSVADLCIMADQYHVSVEAMTRRLERLGCVPAETWNSLSSRSLGSTRIRNEVGLPPQSQRQIALPKRFVRLAVEAFEQEMITESRLARLLRCTRVEAREVVDSLVLSDEINLTDGSTYQLSLNFAESIGSASGAKEAA